MPRFSHASGGSQSKNHLNGGSHDEPIEKHAHKSFTWAQMTGNAEPHSEMARRWVENQRRLDSKQRAVSEADLETVIPKIDISNSGSFIYISR